MARLLAASASRLICTSPSVGVSCSGGGEPGLMDSWPPTLRPGEGAPFEEPPPMLPAEPHDSLGRCGLGLLRTGRTTCTGDVCGGGAGDGVTGGAGGGAAECVDDRFMGRDGECADSWDRGLLLLLRPGVASCGSKGVWNSTET